MSAVSKLRGSMADIKSAWEIAQERANRLGKLSAEEQKQQEEQECRQIAAGIAQKYLNSSETQDIATMLDKYSGEGKKLIGLALFGLLTEAITFDSQTRAEKAAQAIVVMKPKSQPLIGRIIDLLTEYHQAGKTIKKEVETRTKEVLHQLRISGSAIGEINIEASPQWQQNWQRVKRPLEQQLDALKQELHKGKF
jgi:hypothetical protein